MNAKEIYQKMNGDEKLTVRKSAQRLGEISAFAETFMKSINPESVEDMRNVLVTLQKVLEPLTNNPVHESVMKELNAAIEKSKL